VAGNGGIDGFAAVRLAGREGTDLVYSHEAAVTCDISRERRRQSTRSPVTMNPRFA
jgi:hypothetical protein